MNSIARFLRTTITGGILFLLPLTIVYIILSKAHAILEKIAAPILKGAPKSVLGFNGESIIALLLLFFVCFLAGLLFRFTITQKWIKKLEDNFISYLPGYSLMKSITADAINEKVDTAMVPVMVLEDEIYLLGFLTEEHNGYCSVYIPGAPHHNSGEIKIVPSHLVTRINIPVKKAIRGITKLGAGLTEYVPSKKSTAP